MSETVERDYTAGTICSVCGSKEAPNGWLYKSSDVKPVEIENDGIRWEAKDDADAYCSRECVQELES